MASYLGKEKFVCLLYEVGKEVLQYLLYSEIFETILREINIKELLISSDVGKLYGVDRDYHWENLEFLQVPTLKLIIENAERGIAVTKQDNVTSLCRVINKNIIPRRLKCLIEKQTKTRKGISNVCLKKLIFGDNVDIETLDISALCSLIRCLLKKVPGKNDTSERDDVQRLLDYRNKLAHDLSFDVFTAWNEVQSAILGLGRERTIFRDKIEEIKNRRSIDQIKKDLKNTLTDWEAADQQISLDFQKYEESHREELRTQASDIKEEIQSSTKKIESAISQGQKKTEQALDNVVEKYESKIKRYLGTDKGAIPELLQEMKVEIQKEASSNFTEMKTKIEKFVNCSPMAINVQNEQFAKPSDIKESVNKLDTDLKGQKKTEQALDNVVEKYESKIKRYLGTDKGAIPELLQEMKVEIQKEASSNFTEMKTKIEKFVNCSPMAINVQNEQFAKPSDIKESVNKLDTDLKAELYKLSVTTKEGLETVVSHITRLSTDLEKVSSASFCCWWDVDNTDNLQIIESSSQEYKNVVHELQKTEIPHNDVLKVARIQNKVLYQQYEVKKSQMLKENPPGFCSERFLWHRPKYSRIEEINANGFSEVNCGETKDVAYGNGISFLAKQKKYAFTGNKDTHDNQTIYLCSVLTGDFTKGTSQLRLPPRKPDSEAGVCYDSVVDDLDDPKVFVIFHGTQAYPHYLLTFK